MKYFINNYDKIAHEIFVAALFIFSLLFFTLTYRHLGYYSTRFISNFIQDASCCGSSLTSFAKDARIFGLLISLYLFLEIGLLRKLYVVTFLFVVSLFGSLFFIWLMSFFEELGCLISFLIYKEVLVIYFIYFLSVKVIKKFKESRSKL